MNVEPFKGAPCLGLAVWIATGLLAVGEAGLPAVAEPLPCRPWAAVDGLGRRVVDAETCGPVRPGKYVGIFYFQEQWDHALEVDPEFLFITGWNEWVAQRFIVERDRGFADGEIKKGDTWFIDHGDTAPNNRFRYAIRL